APEFWASLEAPARGGAEAGERERTRDLGPGAARAGVRRARARARRRPEGSFPADPLVPRPEAGDRLRRLLGIRQGRADPGPRRERGRIPRPASAEDPGRTDPEGLHASDPGIRDDEGDP